MNPISSYLLGILQKNISSAESAAKTQTDSGKALARRLEPGQLLSGVVRSRTGDITLVDTDAGAIRAKGDLNVPEGAFVRLRVMERGNPAKVKVESWQPGESQQDANRLKTLAAATKINLETLKRADSSLKRAAASSLASSGESMPQEEIALKVRNMFEVGPDVGPRQVMDALRLSSGPAAKFIKGLLSKMSNLAKEEDVKTPINQQADSNNGLGRALEGTTSQNGKTIFDREGALNLNPEKADASSAAKVKAGISGQVPLLEKRETEGRKITEGQEAAEKGQNSLKPQKVDAEGLKSMASEKSSPMVEAAKKEQSEMQASQLSKHQARLDEALGEKRPQKDLSAFSDGKGQRDTLSESNYSQANKKAGLGIGAGKDAFQETVSQKEFSNKVLKGNADDLIGSSGKEKNGRNLKADLASNRLDSSSSSFQSKTGEKAVSPGSQPQGPPFEASSENSLHAQEHDSQLLRNQGHRQSYDGKDAFSPSSDGSKESASSRLSDAGHQSGHAFLKGLSSQLETGFELHSHLVEKGMNLFLIPVFLSQFQGVGQWSYWSEDGSQEGDSNTSTEHLYFDLNLSNLGQMEIHLSKIDSHLYLYLSAQEEKLPVIKDSLASLVEGLKGAGFKIGHIEVTSLEEGFSSSLADAVSAQDDSGLHIVT